MDRFFSRTCISLAACAAIGATGCGEDEPVEPDPIVHDVYFAGYVYDGASGARLTQYTVEGAVRDAKQSGTLDTEGRYALGPFGIWQDYTIVILADGYRFFRSNNGGVELPETMANSEDIGNYSTAQTLHYDAYLFPVALQAPSVAFTISLAGSEEKASGKIRLRPVGASVLADDAAETPAGVTGQVWENDEDLQGQTLTKDFSGGTFEIAAGELVYGVSYQVDIYDVQGYQPLEGGFTAGLESGKTFTLQEELQEPLLLLESTVADCTAPTTPTETKSAVVRMTFSRIVEIGESIYPGGVEEALDDNFYISSYDQDNDFIENTLHPDGTTTSQMRGVSMIVTGNEIELSWNPSLGLYEKDPDDTIDYVSYGGLSNITIQPVGKPTQAMTLSSLIGSTISCYSN